MQQHCCLITSVSIPLMPRGMRVHALGSRCHFFSMDELADQVAEVLDFSGQKEVLCLGVTAGAYILTLFAMKYRERALGLILVSPIRRAPSWSEWLYNKVLSSGPC